MACCQAAFLRPRRGPPGSGSRRGDIARRTPAEGPRPAREFFLLALLPADAPTPSAGSATARAAWLADLDPATVKTRTVGLFVFVPGSRADDVTGHECVETTGAGDVLRVVSFAKDETDEVLDVAQSVVVEGVPTVIRHPVRGQFRAVVELQVRQARKVTY